MDKRFFLALVLTAIVIIATPLLFPNANRRPGSVVPADSVRRAPVASESTAQPSPQSVVAGVPQSATLPSIGSISQPISSVVETTTVRTLRSTYAFTSRGAAPVSVVLDSYPSRRPGATGRKAELVQPRSMLARYRLALGRDG